VQWLPQKTRQTQQVERPGSLSKIEANERRLMVLGRDTGVRAKRLRRICESVDFNLSGSPAERVQTVNDAHDQQGVETRSLGDQLTCRN
jgi:hypothetical protein